MSSARVAGGGGAARGRLWGLVLALVSILGTYGARKCAASAHVAWVYALYKHGDLKKKKKKTP